MSETDPGYYMDDPILRQYRCTYCNGHFFQKNAVKKHVTKHRVPFSAPDLSPVVPNHPQVTLSSTPVATVSDLEGNAVDKVSANEIWPNRPRFTNHQSPCSSSTDGHECSRKRKARSILAGPSKKHKPDESIVDRVSSEVLDKAFVESGSKEKSFEDLAGLGIDDIWDVLKPADNLNLIGDAQPDDSTRTQDSLSLSDKEILTNVPLNLSMESFLTATSSIYENEFNKSLVSLDKSENVASTIEKPESTALTWDTLESTVPALEGSEAKAATKEKSKSTSEILEKSQSVAVAQENSDSGAAMVIKADASTGSKSENTASILDMSEITATKGVKTESTTLSTDESESRSMISDRSESTSVAPKKSESTTAVVTMSESTAAPQMEISLGQSVEWNDVKSNPKIEVPPPSIKEPESPSSENDFLEPYFVRMIPEYCCKKCSFCSFSKYNMDYHCASYHSFTFLPF